MGVHYLDCFDKATCFGCEACVQVCARRAIRLVSDCDGFRYPMVDAALCVNCGLCREVCPSAGRPEARSPLLAFGGYARDEKIREESTSGGVFSVIASSWSDERTVVFGAEAVGLDVRHAWCEGSSEIHRFRKSKYLQSQVGAAFIEAKKFLQEGRRVLFSGTPCQIAGLKKFLRGLDLHNLLTIEVVCEGVPSPNYIHKFADWLGEKCGGKVVALDYRYKDGRKWDFQVMQATLVNSAMGVSKWKQDRWFNPFWSIWLQHLISRPACYKCPFARLDRCADITLGDLWGVHLYCPDLYGRNGGASLVFCNTPVGVAALEMAKPHLFGRTLKVEEAVRYQGPMRSHIKDNPAREECLRDVRELPYEMLVRKWAKRPTLALLWQKYVWGNRQKIWLWNFLNGIRRLWRS